MLQKGTWKLNNNINNWMQSDGTVRAHLNWDLRLGCMNGFHLLQIRILLLHMPGRDTQVLQVRHIGCPELLIHTLQRDLEWEKMLASNSDFRMGKRQGRNIEAREPATTKNMGKLTPLVSGSQNATTAMRKLMDPKMK